MPAINRDWIIVKKLTYTNELDEYGQKRQSEPTQSDLKVVWKLNNQFNVSDPNYVDVDVIALTKDEINDSNQVLKDNIKYNIKWIIPGKYNQLFLNEDK